ncbi:hypothetical protein LACR_0381 [Lactococcus cremoris subsp. cremoris SK11]|uniref:Uncharacterized protein n=1 Tax=Lactococcus lactis subsp. cremoris (strain SK11) TaxID=272622 RepID=Q031Y4_LACLS|nr:hypothetical protein LACR_0381 [Lactococcus cremoris subsp. cremoris SK11]
MSNFLKKSDEGKIFIFADASVSK